MLAFLSNHSAVASSAIASRGTCTCPRSAPSTTPRTASAVALAVRTHLGLKVAASTVGGRVIHHHFSLLDRIRGWIAVLLRAHRGAPVPRPGALIHSRAAVI